MRTMSETPSLSLIRIKAVRSLDGTGNNTGGKSDGMAGEEKSIEELLHAFNEEVHKRLNAVDQRLDSINDTCDELEVKIEQLSNVLNERSEECLPDTYVECCSTTWGPSPPSALHGITLNLNTEDQFPDGSWLGDESKPELRVRCPIKAAELFHINMTCTTADKMALTLLDHLFPREVQACSNISGTGKHKKKRLDPLFIYGIQCHLILHFGISILDWERIKQNIDSKCRSAFRRKVKGLPLKPQSPSFINPNSEGLVNFDPNVANAVSMDDEHLDTFSVDSSGDGSISGEIIPHNEMLREVDSSIT